MCMYPVGYAFCSLVAAVRLFYVYRLVIFVLNESCFMPENVHQITQSHTWLWIPVLIRKYFCYFGTAISFMILHIHLVCVELVIRCIKRLNCVRVYLVHWCRRWDYTGNGNSTILACCPCLLIRIWTGWGAPCLVAKCEALGCSALVRLSVDWVVLPQGKERNLYVLIRLIIHNLIVHC